MRSRHVLVKDVHGDLDQGGVGDPSSIVTRLDLSLLVGPDLGHGLFVGGVVPLDRDLSRHASHGGDFSLVAGLDEELDVGFHEGDGHGHVGSVRHDIGL